MRTRKCITSETTRNYDMIYHYLLAFSVLITHFSEVFAGEYCTICSGQIYCDSGCCSTYGSTHCCPNTTAIVVGSVFGTFVVMVILAAVFICWLQNRRNRLDTINKYIVAQTQYYTEDFTGDDDRRPILDTGGPPKPVNKPTLPDQSLFRALGEDLS